LGWNLGGINGSGQVPKIEGLPTLIDSDTPANARSRTGFDGETYNLVFSDEFNTDGRTFWHPFWEAVDLHYWGTKDLQWYDPDAITTKDGNLEITMTQEPIHNLNFRSGMLQSWNKFCFTGGYIEVSMSMPGTSKAMGFWPGAWTLGNLGRAGYGGTNHGVWPYTYGACDVGTLPNQTWPNGTSPAAAKSSGSEDYGGELSWLPGQRLSACTCEGEDHPGPNVRTGRGAPEIDINEMQVDYRGTGSTSQSIQFAPIDAGYNWLNETPQTTMYNEDITFQNIWHGSVNQESASVITLTDDTSYDGKGYTTFGFEYEKDKAITWAVNATPSWQLSAAAIGPNAEAQISQRLISEEPMSIILNLGISESFQPPEWGKIQFPGVLRFDYVRVYQKGTPQVTCDPASHPTADYINRHLDVYNNPNITIWDSSNNLTFPKNRLSATGCD
ncbi:family 16 glycoside hydrolase, partial [Leucosporidium creatinivorum]